MMLLFALILTQSLIAPPEILDHPEWENGIVPKGVVGLFTPLKYTATSGPHEGSTFFFRLYEPPISDPEKQYPILVWTSGYGEMGDDNFAQLRHLHNVFINPEAPKNYPFYCLVMQVPKEIGSWVDENGNHEFDMAGVLMNILEATMKERQIDPDRVYLSGVSLGGDVCWELAMRHPDRFAAVAPLASSGGRLDKERLKLINHIPVWAFHSTNDPISPIGPVQQTTSLLKKLGGNVHLTEVEAKYHDCWTPAFVDYDLMDWMLAQRRGKDCVELPGRSVTRWWHLVAPFSILVIIALAVALELRRRKHARTTK